MNTTHTRGMLVLAAAVFFATLAPASAQSAAPAQWVVLDPVQLAPVAERVEAPIITPDGGAIQGTLISKGRYYAVTPRGMAQVGDPIGNCRIASVSLDRVVLTAGTRSFELDVTAGVWSARTEVAAGE